MLPAVVLCEYFAKFSPEFGRAGMIIWYLLLVFLFGFAVYCFYFLIKIQVKNRCYISLLAIILFMALLTTNISDLRNLSGETTQETTCILKQISDSPSAGFNSLCFLGYPAKQFYFSALPTLLFGRTIFSLNSGGSLYFLLGIVVFLAGIFKRFINNPKSAEIITVFSLAIPLHFYYFNYLLGNFEQSFFPVSLGFLLAGSYLFFLEKRENYLMLLMAFILLILINTYTTGLALVLLALMVGIYELLKEKQDRKMLLMLMLFALIFIDFYLSLQYRLDLRLQIESTEQNPIKDQLVKGFQILTTQTGGQPYFSFILFPVFWMLTAVLIFGPFKRSVLFVLIWVFGVFTAAIIFAGYATPSVDYSLHRAIIIVPILLTTVILWYKKPWEFKNKVHKAAIFFGVFLLITGIINNLEVLRSREISKYFDFSIIISWLKNKIPDSSGNLNTAMPFYFSVPESEKYLNFKDFASYFYPNFNFNYSKQVCDFTLNNSTDSYFLITEEVLESKCLQGINENLVDLGNFQDKEKVILNLYLLPADSKKF